MQKQATKKVYHFYIDESGGILNNTPYFIMGCVRTDTPSLINRNISDLLSGFEDELYFSPLIEKIRKQGFHAVENHPDVRAKFFAVLPTLNFRSFFCVINKNESPFKELVRKNEEKQIYLTALDKILKGRFNNRDTENIFFFEELQLTEGGQKRILEEYFAPYMAEGNIAFEIVGKENLLLATVDYMNYILFQILREKDLSKIQRIVDNLELVKQKIAFINFLPSNKFLTRKDIYSAEIVRQIYSG